MNRGLLLLVIFVPILGNEVARWINVETAARRLYQVGEAHITLTLTVARSMSLSHVKIIGVAIFRHEASSFHCFPHRSRSR
jgi:hypothetical protein